MKSYFVKTTVGKLDNEVAGNLAENENNIFMHSTAQEYGEDEDIVITGKTWGESMVNFNNKDNAAIIIDPVRVELKPMETMEEAKNLAKEYNDSYKDGGTWAYRKIDFVNTPARDEGAELKGYNGNEAGNRDDKMER